VGEAKKAIPKLYNESEQAKLSLLEQEAYDCATVWINISYPKTYVSMK